ncbi:hypothetical protein C7447_102196 [Tenacibaculum adriaticum]|uniref:Uncharacterized protein n=1 Tax=Tenacibaculum adriaticum TaxID=413713 RepID=A0A5S5DU33_9FLAO|nr:hypothetical protein [Tenacibaculum adriaticum]TYP98878.1 hypothetical protein C7447_102196 [Tenacibaculum adriaticum]
MKTILQLFLLLTFVSFTTKKETIQNDPITIEATFDGFDEDGFSFSFTNDDDENETIIFETISSDLLKKYDLKSDELIGEEFELTYKTQAPNDEDSDPTFVLMAIKKI